MHYLSNRPHQVSIGIVSVTQSKAQPQPGSVTGPVKWVDDFINNVSIEQPSLEQLVVLVANQRDTQAFTLLFERCAAGTFALAMKILRNEAVAHEAVQEAMLAVWQKAPLYNLDKGSAKTWVFTIVRNRCFDLLRRQKGEPDTISSDDIWPLYDQQANDRRATDTDDNEIAVEITLVRQHLQQLPDAQKEIVETVFLQDKTHQEAAIELGIPLGTVKSRLRLALKKLQELTGPLQ